MREEENVEDEETKIKEGDSEKKERGRGYFWRRRKDARASKVYGNVKDGGRRETRGGGRKSGR